MTVYVKFPQSLVILRSFNSSSSCFRKNFLRRKPIRVINVPMTETSISSSLQNFSIKNSISVEKEKQLGEVNFPVYSPDDGPIMQYEKLQVNDSRFTKILAIVKNRDLREKKRKMLLEGKRLINDAIEAGIELETLFFSREKDLSGIKLRPELKIEIFKVLYQTMKIWSDLTTCPGIMGVFKRPKQDYISVLSEPAIPVTIICDNIRDPGNLGSIIRNAAASGCRSIILVRGCVDPWETKVLRTGCGGHFRIPILTDIEWMHISNYIPKEGKIYIADNTADIEATSFTPEFISYDESQDECDESPKYITMSEDNQPIRVDETFNHPSELEKYEEISLPCYLYSSIKYPKNDIVVYIGGETHGVNPRIVKLACEYGGKKIKIPLENGMDSLNSSFALTIMLYEIKRQLSEKYVFK